MAKRKTRATRRFTNLRRRRRTGGEGREGREGTGAKTKRTWFQIAKDNPYVSVPAGLAAIALTGKYGLQYVLRTIDRTRIYNYETYLYKTSQKMNRFIERLPYNLSNAEANKAYNEHQKMESELFKKRYEFERFMNKHPNFPNRDHYFRLSDELIAISTQVYSAITAVKNR